MRDGFTRFRNCLTMVFMAYLLFVFLCSTSITSPKAPCPRDPMMLKSFTDIFFFFFFTLSFCGLYADLISTSDSSLDFDDSTNISLGFFFECSETFVYNCCYFSFRLLLFYSDIYSGSKTGYCYSF